MSMVCGAGENAGRTEPEKAQMSDHLLVNHCRLITKDLDEARDYCGRLWERHDSHLRRGSKYRIR